MQTLFGRSHELQAFEDAVNRARDSRRRQVVVFYGPGGQGKTELCSAIANSVASDQSRSIQMSHSLIDFKARSTQALEALYSMRVSLMGRRLIHLPCFDVAFQAYQRRLNPGIDIKKRYPEIFLESDVSSASGDLTDILLELGSTTARHIPFVTMMEKYARRLVDHIGHVGTRRLRQELATMNLWSNDEWLDQLPALLAGDISDLASNNTLPLIMFDHYEYLWQGAVDQNPLARDPDRWIRIFCERLTAGVCVIFFRERVDHWLHISPRWATEDLCQIPLSKITARESIRLLSASGVKERPVRKKILQLADGHPLFLKIQVETYQALKRAGREPQPEDFAGTKQEVIARFVDHLDPHDSLCLKILSIPLAIDEELFNFLADHLPRAFFGLTFDNVSSYSFFQNREDGYKVMHSVMRRGLQALCDPATASRTHKLTFEFAESHWRELAPDNTARAVTYFRTAARHKLQFDETGFPQWILGAVGEDPDKIFVPELEQACKVAESHGLIQEQLECMWRLSFSDESLRRRGLLQRISDLMGGTAFNRQALANVRLIDAMLDTDKAEDIVAACKAVAPSIEHNTELDPQWRAHFQWCWAQAAGRRQSSEGFEFELTDEYETRLNDALRELQRDIGKDGGQFLRVLYEKLNFLKAKKRWEDLRNAARDAAILIEGVIDPASPAERSAPDTNLQLELLKRVGIEAVSAKDLDILRALGVNSDEELGMRLTIPSTEEERRTGFDGTGYPAIGPVLNIGLVVNARGKMCLVFDTPFCTILDRYLHMRYDVEERRLFIVLNNELAYGIDWVATDDMHKYLTKIERILLIRMSIKRPVEGYDCTFLVCGVDETRNAEQGAIQVSAT